MLSLIRREANQWAGRVVVAAAARRAVRPLVEAVERRVLLSAGDPDVSFGMGGAAAAAFSAVANPIPGQTVEQPQFIAMDTRGGKTVVLVSYDVYVEALGNSIPYLAVARLDAKGMPDPTFAGDGSAELQGYQSASSVFIQPDGKVLIGGVTEMGDQGIYRLTASGEPDDTFAGGGFSVAGQIYGIDVNRVMIDPQGRIVWVGDHPVSEDSDGTTWHNSPLVGRLLPDGSLDTSFGGGTGMVVTDVMTPVSQGEVDLAVQSDGKIVVATTGQTGNAADPTNPVVVRLTESGAYDTSFGTNGHASVNLGVGDRAGSVTLAPGGKIVVGAETTSLNGRQYIQPFRLNANGTLDLAFYRVSLGSDTSSALAVRAGSDGKVVTLGFGLPDGASLIRYNADGTLDKTFAPGLGFFPVPGASNAQSLDLQADNQILTAGFDLNVRRFWYPGGPDPSGISLSATTGTLTVNGTGGNDTINAAEIISPIPATGSVLRVRKNGFYRGFSPGLVKRMTVNAGSGNDTVDLKAMFVPTTIYGGAGNDTLTGGSAADRIFGGAGDDRLFGRAGNDILKGEDGNDRLDGGTGGDDLSGGFGYDTLDYGARTKALYIGLGTFADDGEAGEHDNARSDNEVVIGGSGNDTIIGTSAANLFYGNGGDDQLYGRGGDDILVGGAGHNRLSGEDGNDTLYAKNGLSDVIDGGAGTDKAQRDAIDSVKNVEKFI
jgi:uncharacterized delta-60 repeat protein